jgi:membrane-associated phospholipid phosphatase
MREPRSRSAAGLVALALAGVAGVAATFALFVRTRYGQRIDQGALEGRAIATPGAREAASDLLTTISVGSLVLALALLVGLALLRRRAVLALVAGTVIAGSIVTTEILKDVLLRRPDLIGVTPFANTFPSGHATIALGVGVAATLVVPPRLRRPVAWLAVAYAVAVGVALLAAGWHRPSDIAGGYFVVVAWAAAAVLVGAAIDADAFHDARRELRRRPGGFRYPVLAGGVLVAAYFVAVGAAAASDIGAIDWTLINAAFLAACAAIASLAVLLMAALLAALRSSEVPPRS